MPCFFFLRRFARRTVAVLVVAAWTRRPVQVPLLLGRLCGQAEPRGGRQGPPAVVGVRTTRAAADRVPDALRAPLRQGARGPRRRGGPRSSAFSAPPPGRRPPRRRRTHCGVLEFTAPEGNCYVPFWMMQNLMLEEGGVLSVKNVSLPKATYVKFKPADPRPTRARGRGPRRDRPRLAGRSRRTFWTFRTRGPSSRSSSGPFPASPSATRSACRAAPAPGPARAPPAAVLSSDRRPRRYNNKRFYLEVQEVKPSEAACIIECDCNARRPGPRALGKGSAARARKRRERPPPRARRSTSTRPWATRSPTTPASGPGRRARRAACRTSPRRRRP